ncbi:MAG TPA: hypothetical protein VMU51_34135 [Mycobacteriales bacterium]|nr:hypothetical protein [Mycobacteriales bacterium]
MGDAQREHYLAAERLLAAADGWMDADIGWQAHMSTDERIARRRADLAAAQVHATLAAVPAPLGPARMLQAVPDGPDEDSEREWAAEGMATALSGLPDDAGRDLDDDEDGRP